MSHDPETEHIDPIVLTKTIGTFVDAARRGYARGTPYMNHALEAAEHLYSQLRSGARVGPEGQAEALLRQAVNKWAHLATPRSRIENHEDVARWLQRWIRTVLKTLPELQSQPKRPR